MGINIAKLVAKNLKKSGKAIGVKPCTLIKVTPGTRVPGNYSGGTQPVETSYPCSGMIEVLTGNDIADGLVQIDDRKIDLLGATIGGGTVIPSSGDKVTITDLDGVSKTLRLIGIISGAGVGAVYSFQARK